MLHYNLKVWQIPLQLLCMYKTRLYQEFIDLEVETPASYCVLWMYLHCFVLPCFNLLRRNAGFPKMIRLLRTLPRILAECATHLLLQTLTASWNTARCLALTWSPLLLIRFGSPSGLLSWRRSEPILLTIWRHKTSWIGTKNSLKTYKL